VYVPGFRTSPSTDTLTGCCPPRGSALLGHARDTAATAINKGEKAEARRERMQWLAAIPKVYSEVGGFRFRSSRTLKFAVSFTDYDTGQAT